MSKDGAEVASFAYDPLGRRIRKATPAATFRHTYDGMDILREKQVGPEATASKTYTYVHGPGIDEPLGREDEAGVVGYYHADALGSVVAMSDAAGVAHETRRYDARGNLEVGADEPEYAFTGREWDPETGLYYSEPDTSMRDSDDSSAKIRSE